jgi:hypothetical protein
MVVGVVAFFRVALILAPFRPRRVGLIEGNKTLKENSKTRLKNRLEKALDSADVDGDWLFRSFLVFQKLHHVDRKIEIPAIPFKVER